MKKLSKINSWVTSCSHSLSAWSSLITIVSIPLLFASFFLGYHEIRQITVSPDPIIEFNNPRSVGYTIFNRSQKIAKDVVVVFTFVDLDAPQRKLLSLASVNHNYINPNSKSGPYVLFQKFAIPGHRYYGFVLLGCRAGEKIRRYNLFVRHNHPEDGFYIELTEKDSDVVVPDKLAMDNDYFESFYPKNRRQMIQINSESETIHSLQYLKLDNTPADKSNN